jgi:hypothetical protein
VATALGDLLMRLLDLKGASTTGNRDSAFEKLNSEQ